MAHIHEIKDAEAHFIINATTREISNTDELPALVQIDHNSERFTFVAPRYVDGHDLSICNKVRVHYINIGSDKIEKYADVYEVDDLHIDETDETKVVCTWLISKYATQLAGSLNFIVEYACESNSIIDYAWHTAIFKGITVKEGINNTEQIMTEYTDILEKWKNDVLAEIGQGGGDSGGKGIESITIGDVDLNDGGFGTGTLTRCLIIKYTDDTETVIPLPDVFKQELNIVETENGIEIHFTDGDGSLNIYTIENGADYVLTEEDKTEIAEQAVELIDTALLPIIGSGVIE